MADDSTTESPWSTPLKALIGSATFSGLHPDGQTKAVAQIAAATNPGWDKATPQQQDNFIKQAISKYGTAGPDASQATKQSPGILTKLGRASAEALPYAGMLAGGAAGVPLAPETLGTSVVAGAGLGYAEGEAIKRPLLGEQLQSVGGTALQTGKDVVEGAKGEIAGQITGALAKPGSEWLAGKIQDFTGTSDLIAGARQSVKEVETAQKGVAEAQKTANEQRTKALDKITTDLQKQTTAAAKEEVLSTATGGRTKADTNKTINPEPTAKGEVAPETLQHYQDVNKALNGPMDRAMGLSSKEYSEIENKYGKTKVDVSDGQAFVKSPDVKRWQGQLNGEGQSLLKDAKKLFSIDDEEAPPTKPGQMTAAEINQLAAVKSPGAYNIPAIKDNVTGKVFENPQGHGMAFEDFEKATKDSEKFTSGFVRDGKFLTKEEALKTTDKLLGPKQGMDSEPATPPKPTAKFIQLRQLRNRASDLAKIPAGKDDPTQTFAWQLKNKLDTMSENANIPGFKELNQKWNYYHDSFDQIKNKLVGSKTPEKDAGVLFNEPHVSNFITANATPAEKAIQRPLFYDYVQLHGGAEKVIKPEMAPTLNHLYGDTAFGKIDGWYHAEDATQHFGQVIKDAPIEAAKYQLAYQDGVKQVTNDYAQKFVDAALEEAGKIKGPEGEKISAAILKAPGGAKGQAKVASQVLMHADLDQVVRDSLKSGRVAEKTTFVPGIGMGIKNRYLFYVGALMAGATSPYMKIMGAASGVIAANSLARATNRYLVKNSPELVEKYIGYMTDPWKAKAIEYLGTMGAKAWMSNTMEDLHIQTQPEPKPVKQDVPKTKAENVSMGATGSSKLSDLSKAPIQTSMQAYNKAVNEDNDPDTAKQIKSIITAKLNNGQGLQSLDANTRAQLATMLKEEPQLADLSRERTEMKGTG